MHDRMQDVSLDGSPELGVVPRDEAVSARLEYRRLYRRVALTDALSILVALLVASAARYGFHMPGHGLWVLIPAAPPVLVALFAGFKLYEAYRFTPAEEFRRIILAVSVGLTGIVTVSFWSKEDPSRAWLALSWGLALVLALTTRRLWHLWIGRARQSGRLAFPTLVVGGNEEGLHLERLMSRPSFGFRPIGLVTTGESDRTPSDLPVVGSIRDLREIIRRTGAECVFVAASALSTDEMKDVAKAVRLEGVEVRVTATLPEVLSSRLAVQPLGGLMTLSLKPVELTGTQVVVKRAFDLVVSAAAITVLTIVPVLPALALAVRFTSAGPVLYRQRRVGKRGRPFTMLKFRTMFTGADQKVEELRRERGVEDLMFKLRDDPRVTRIGRFLRRWSLDELPQLFNVLYGEMSLVGPRPPLPEEVSQYEDWHFDRLEVEPGLTGLWQVSGRAELSFDECVRLDLFYIENWSLAYDLYIIAKTIPVLVLRRGAY